MIYRKAKLVTASGQHSHRVRQSEPLSHESHLLGQIVVVILGLKREAKLLLEVSHEALPNDFRRFVVSPECENQTSARAWYIKSESLIPAAGIVRGINIPNLLQRGRAWTRVSQTPQASHSFADRTENLCKLRPSCLGQALLFCFCSCMMFRMNLNL